MSRVPDPTEIAANLERLLGPPPEFAIVLGSGLGGLADRLSDVRSAAYAEVGLPSTGVVGHSGRISVGQLGARRVAVLAGRLHLYEGYSSATVAVPVRSCAAWGVETVVLTSAVGSMDASLAPGALMLVTDHINLSGDNPLCGPQLPGRPSRFVDMTHAYDPELGEVAHSVAKEQGTALHEGVYVALMGPSYETPAEIRMLAALGARTVGMSLVHEVIAARHEGMRVLAFNVVSNFAAGLTADSVSHEQVTQMVAGSAEQLADLLAEFVSRAPARG